ncbi:MAG: hypothetical protein GPJ10_01545 [Microcystis aeruginosa L211-07]|nr:hypothetical protein [Microcystis aeruginosa L211-07]
MYFHNVNAFCRLTPDVKEFAVKLEDMLVKLGHHLSIDKDGFYCKIFYFSGVSANVYPEIYDTKKVYEVLNNFNKPQSYLWSCLQNCKA